MQTLENLLNEADLTLYNLLKEKQLLNKIPRSYFKTIANKYFKNEDEKNIIDLLIKACISDVDDLGIVIAGFNENTIYPSYSSYKVFGVFNGEIIYKKLDEKIGSKEAQIITFAQDEAINSFLYGIDEDILNLINDFVNTIINTIFDSFNSYNEENLNSNELKGFINYTKIKNQQYLDKFFNLINITNKARLLDILNSIDSLPKKDFSELTEFFIHMSSLYYKLTSYQTTVGEDINVALVSKKTGFSWLKYENLFK